MVELTPEERQKVYEEEKARFEAQKLILQEEYDNIPEEEKATAELAQQLDQQLLASIILLIFLPPVGIFFLVASWINGCLKKKQIEQKTEEKNKMPTI